MMRNLFLSMAVFIVIGEMTTGCSGSSSDYRDWRVSGGSRQNIKYSSITQIDTQNVKELEVAWMYRSENGDSTRFGPMQSNPVVVNGILYGVSPRLKLFAIDAATGDEKWVFDPSDSAQNKSWVRNSVNMNRGVAYWEDGEDKRIIFTVGSVAFAVNALTGKLIPGFGVDGGINLNRGLDRDENKVFVAPTSPVMIYKDLFILSGLVSDETPGHIRAFDVRTGAQRWIFHTIPYPGEPGHETWEDSTAYQYMGSTNSWGGFSLDEKRGILFAPTGNPTNDFYGGQRLGQGLYGNCLLALDAATGRLIWHFQTVHHDVWDMDVPTPPALVTIVRDGKKVDAVAFTTKTAFVFVFNRETGEPLFPIDEKPVPTNNPATGEKLWPTQPIPRIPKPFARQRMTIDDLNTLVPDSSYQDIRERFLSLRSEGMFTPPTVEGTLILPGYDGGGEWGGPAVDPETNLLYVNANEMAWILNLVPNKPKPTQKRTNLEAGAVLYQRYCMGCHGPERTGSGDFPSIVHADQQYTTSSFLELLSTGRRMMPGFNHLHEEEKKAIASFVLNDRPTQQNEYKGPVEKTSGAPEATYTFTGYNKFLTKEGYPAIAPPWGSLSAIDLNTGEYAWKIPLGEFEELKQKGIPATGRENYGGPVVTAGGVLFIAATADGKFRAFNKRTGELLWETDLPAPGVATPAVYEQHGRQYVVIACGGSKWGGVWGDAYVAFALPEKSR